MTSKHMKRDVCCRETAKEDITSDHEEEELRKQEEEIVEKQEEIQKDLKKWAF